MYIADTSSHDESHYMKGKWPMTKWLSLGLAATLVLYHKPKLEEKPMESARRIEVVYDGIQHCTARQAEGKRSVIMDAPASCGGASAEEFAPDELVAAGLGGCTLLSMQMGLLVQRRDVDLIGARVHATVRMACGSSQRVAGVDIEVRLPRAIPADDRRALEQAARACPLTASFHPDIPITVKFAYPEA